MVPLAFAAPECSVIGGFDGRWPLLFLEWAGASLPEMDEGTTITHHVLHLGSDSYFEG